MSSPGPRDDETLQGTGVEDTSSNFSDSDTLRNPDASDNDGDSDTETHTQTSIEAHRFRVWQEYYRVLSRRSVFLLLPEKVTPKYIAELVTNRDFELRPDGNLRHFVDLRGADGYYDVFDAPVSDSQDDLLNGAATHLSKPPCTLQALSEINPCHFEGLVDYLRSTQDQDQETKLIIRYHTVQPNPLALTHESQDGLGSFAQTCALTERPIAASNIVKVIYRNLMAIPRRRGFSLFPAEEFYLMDGRPGVLTSKSCTITAEMNGETKTFVFDSTGGRGQDIEFAIRFVTSDPFTTAEVDGRYYSWKYERHEAQQQAEQRRRS